ncbi:MAG: hypothetical protein LBH44_02145 [Treponema sp.]|jgi:transposase-like protein|nr:hypothetical protein [Treponema sp.]
MKRFSEEEKAMWLEDWRKSGKSAWTYAKENGHVPQTFAKWTKAETEPQTYFVEVPRPVIPAARQIPAIVIERGAVKIHIPVTVSTGELRTVLEGLGGVL